MKHSLFKRLTALMIAAMLLLFPAGAETLKSAPLTAGNTQNGMVRVRLSSLGSPSTLDLTIYGSYTVNGNTSKELKSGAKATVSFHQSVGTLSLTTGGVTTNMGTSFKLRRHETSGENGIKIAQGRSPGNLYPGDFQFIVRGSAGSYSLYVIAYIYMEDYLYGVVPYEMGNSSGLEALKAQAVAARTYTMRAMNNASSSSLYDVVDTTGDQVYSGTPSASENCKAAVDMTKGIVLKNGNAFTATYYTASNGGQTESIKNAWGSSGYSYLTVKDDPYDLANPDSRKRSFSVNASGSQSNAALGTLLNQKAAGQFGSGASVTGVTAVYAHTPKYAEPSRLYTKLSFDVTYALNGVSGRGTLTFDIFSELESALSMNITTGSNELWSVMEKDGGFTVTARRYGHGIGMSQRGAMYMDKLGYTYDQILAFYFEGCARVQYTLTRSILSPVVSGQESQEQVISEEPVELPDPAAPTATPVVASLYAKVNTPRNSLNLRQSASDTAKVLLTIPRGETIPILERGSAWCKTSYRGVTGYVMTTYLTFTGVVQPTATPTPTAAPTAAPAQETRYARVNTGKGSLNLRAAAKSTAKVLGTIPQDQIIPILEVGDAWCKTEYNGMTGYVMTSFLAFLNDAPAPAVTPTTAPATPPPTSVPVATAAPTAPPPVTAAPAPQALYARVTTISGSLNLRAAANSTARVLRTIPQYEIILILERGAVWCKTEYDGLTGYVMTSFLTFLNDYAPAATPAPTPALTPAPTSAPDAVSTPVVQAPYARVTTSSGSLNLRAAARDTARVLMTIPQNDTVIVLANLGVWCQVTYNGVTGYVMTRYLTFLNETPATAAPVVTTPTPAPASTPSPDGMLALVSTTSGSLNLRAAARDTARVLLTIPQYATVTVLSYGPTWCQVTYNGVTGYAMTKFLTLLNGQPTQAPATPAPTAAPPSSYPAGLTPLQQPVQGRVMSTGRSLNLRSGCSTDAAVLTEIPKYANVTITAVGDTWCAVEYEGKSGYCMRKYLEFSVYGQ